MEVVNLLRNKPKRANMGLANVGLREQPPPPNPRNNGTPPHRRWPSRNGRLYWTSFLLVCGLVWNTSHYPLHIPKFLIQKLRQVQIRIKQSSHRFTFFHIETLEDLHDIAPLIHGDRTGFSIPLVPFLGNNAILGDRSEQIPSRAQFKPLQLGYIACQYNQIIHVEDRH